jgi:uncharacterized protein involved in exopolysaccharide biosynthesis
MSEFTPQAPADDEIDLLELIRVLWDGKLQIIAVTAIAAITSVIVSLSMPNIYHAQALLAPANDEGGGLSRMAGQFGGLAALAGVSLPGGGADRTALALEVLKSRKFVREFTGKHKIAPQLLAAESWNEDSRVLSLDADVYNEKTGVWLDEDGPPTPEDIYEAFTDALIVEEDAASGFVRVGFKHLSPDVGALWTSLAIKDLNNAIRAQDIAEAESSIAYLRQQVEATPLAELRKVFFDLIQAQTETMMLAQVREEYVFKTLDPALAPERKSEPKRALICILGTMLGGMIGVIYVLGRAYFRPQAA